MGNDGESIASLPMYDRPELVGAHDRFWSLIRAELRDRAIDAPESLTREITDLWSHWRAPSLVLSQTCGMPFRLRLHEEVTLVGTPDYGVEGCPAGHYCSRLVVRAADARDRLEEFDGARFAFNDRFSQSGFSAPLTHIENRRMRFGTSVETGGHRASAHAVADGDADIAALDAVTWRLLQRFEPTLGSLRVLDSTAPTPGLPYITRAGEDAEAVFDCVQRALVRLDATDRAELGIHDLVAIPAEAYLAVRGPKR